MRVFGRRFGVYFWLSNNGQAATVRRPFWFYSVMFTKATPHPFHRPEPHARAKSFTSMPMRWLAAQSTAMPLLNKRIQPITIGKTVIQFNYSRAFASAVVGLAGLPIGEKKLAAKLWVALEYAGESHAVREKQQLAEEFEFIDQLITMRTKAGLTQDQIAKKLGNAKSNISRLERGRSNPSWGTLKKYARACGYHVKREAVEDKKETAQVAANL